jgi:quaternary ammonium compound-resistance protein SugE
VDFQKEGSIAMNWLFLIVAGVMEWGWPVGLKLAMTDKGLRIMPGIFALICILLSGAFLLLAQRTIPMGTAYAVWTGIGAVGTFLVGIAFFNEPAEVLRFASVGLIVIGIVGLKLTSGH